MKYLTILLTIAVAAVLVVGSMRWRETPTAGPARRTLPAPNGPLTYVALGDSTVYGIGASRPELNYVSRLAERLRGSYPQVRLSNLGVSGAVSADVVAGQLERAVAAQPDLVTLSVGPNDITHGQDAQQYEQNLNTIFRTLTERTHAVVVVNLLPDLGVAPRFPAELKPALEQQTQRYNAALERAAKAYDVEVVDIYTPSRREIPAHPEQVSADNYHPSDAGYARWAELMWAGVAKRLG